MPISAELGLMIGYRQTNAFKRFARLSLNRSKKTSLPYPPLRRSGSAAQRMARKRSAASQFRGGFRTVPVNRNGRSGLTAGSNQSLNIRPNSDPGSLIGYYSIGRNRILFRSSVGLHRSDLTLSGFESAVLESRSLTICELAHLVDDFSH